MSGAERKAALRDANAVETILVEIDHPDGMIYAWPGVAPIDHDGNTYEGLDTFGSVSEVGSDTEIRTDEIVFQVSGVDPDLLDGLSSSVKGRFGTVYGITMTPDYVIRSKQVEATALLDYQAYQIDDDGKATIRIVGRFGMIALERRTTARFSPEDFKSIYPDETGFDQMHLQEDAEITWAAA